MCRTTVSNSFRPLGEQEQYATGLIYFNARYYDPKIGRFLTEDPARQGTGWYSYCGNNPVNAVDPDGRYSMAQGELTGTHSGYGESVGTQLNESGGGVASASIAAAALASAVLPLPGARIAAAGLGAIAVLMLWEAAKKAKWDTLTAMDVLKTQREPLDSYYRGLSAKDCVDIVELGYVRSTALRVMHERLGRQFNQRWGFGYNAVWGGRAQPIPDLMKDKMLDLGHYHSQNPRRAVSPFVGLSKDLGTATMWGVLDPRARNPMHIVAIVQTDRAVFNLLGIDHEVEYLVPMILRADEITNLPEILDKLLLSDASGRNLYQVLRADLDHRR